MFSAKNWICIRNWITSWTYLIDVEDPRYIVYREIERLRREKERLRIEKEKPIFRQKLKTYSTPRLLAKFRNHRDNQYCFEDYNRGDFYWKLEQYKRELKKREHISGNKKELRKLIQKKGERKQGRRQKGRRF